MVSFILFAFSFLLLACAVLGSELRVRDLVVPHKGNPVPMRCYGTDDEKPRPLIVLLHGAGGFARYAAHYESHAAALVARGYRVCAVFYAEGEEGRFDDWVAAASAAIDHLSGIATTKPGGVGLLGFSRGGYVAVAVAGINPKVRALVGFYGGVLPYAEHRPSRLPPTLILHGDADPVVPVQEAYALEELAKATAPSYVMKIYPGAGHGFDGLPNDSRARDARKRTLEFFATHLAGAGK
jgi:dienelactone hydrolase